MENNLNSNIKQIRKMPSNQAADWILQNFPLDAQNYWEAFQLIPHISWKRSDQMRLARCYLKKIPFANAKGYEIFISFMSFRNFIRVIQEEAPIKKDDIGLLLYYLIPVLERGAKTYHDHELISKFVAELTMS